MPTQIFKCRDPETGALADVEHWSLSDTARLFHCRRDLIKEGADQGRFPHLKIGARYWFSADDHAAIYAALHVDGPEPCRPAPLGTVVDDPDTALRGVR